MAVYTTWTAQLSKYMLVSLKHLSSTGIPTVFCYFLNPKTVFVRCCNNSETVSELLQVGQCWEAL